MSDSTEILLQVRDLKLQFGDKVVLNGVSFSICKQEVLVIMGLSGCGKSTVLNIIMGLLEPTSGGVLFKDKELTHLARKESNEIRTHFGMVYQNAALISSFNVHDNIGMPLRELTEKSDGEINAIIDSKLELVGLRDAQEKLPSELSGGMQKRAGLARALALEPELVLFDEPSAGLDPINSKLIDDLIIQLRDKQKVTSIVVTHEMESAFAVATRMVFLHEGQVILDATPDDFKKSDNKIVREFISAYTDRARK